MKTVTLVRDKAAGGIWFPGDVESQKTIHQLGVIPAQLYNRRGFLYTDLCNLIDTLAFAGHTVVFSHEIHQKPLEALEVKSHGPGNVPKQGPTAPGQGG